MTLQINNINKPLCDWTDCGAAADYEFTDILPVNEKGEMKSISIAHACFNHVEEINIDLKKEEVR